MVGIRDILVAVLICIEFVSIFGQIMILNLFELWELAKIVNSANINN